MGSFEILKQNQLSARNFEMFLEFIFGLILVQVHANSFDVKSKAEYDLMREQFMLRNDNRSFDAYIRLSKEERKVDKILATMRDEYVSRTKADGSFAPARYFHSWDLMGIRSEALFQFIDKLPKGGSLHLHSASFGSIDWVLAEGLEMPGCNVFLEEDTKEYHKGTFAFWREGKAPHGFKSCKLLSDTERQTLRSLWTSNISWADLDSKRSWQALNTIFDRISPGMNHRPLVLKYLENTFRKSLENGITHLEIRVLCGADNIGALSDLDGNVYNGSAIIDTYKEALHRFQESSPKLFSLNIIAATLRARSEVQIMRDLELAYELQRQYPDFVVGWDAVGEEAAGHPTVDVIRPFLRVRKAMNNVNLPLFLHDGESTSRDDSNVVDAVLLQCPRIGHGFNAGVFFPELREKMKEQGTLLEVNPISNQVLHYVGNIENHPAASLAFDGISVVIGSDDPGAFGYEGLTYDWWAATTAWRLNLKSLKALALNSLQKSSMTVLKDSIISQWHQDWEHFISGVVNDISYAKDKALTNVV